MPNTHYTTDQAVREAIQNIAVGPDRGRDISHALAYQVMSAILKSEVDPVQAAIFLIALRMKRESLDEFAGIYQALSEQVLSATAPIDHLVCLADPFDGYLRSVTMTPFIPPVLAALGVPAVLHGVESVGPKHGVTAHKVYRLAGMNPVQSVAQGADQLSSHACTYLDQSVYAPALFALSGLRDKMIKRTAVTTLERVLMPIQGRQSTQLVLGYVHRAYPEIYARMALQAGYDSILLTKGVEGGLAPALNKPLRHFYLEFDRSKEFEIEKELIDAEAMFDSRHAAMKIASESASVNECLEAGISVLSGNKGVARDSLCLAAGQILYAQKKTMSLAQAVENVRNCLDNGAAKERFYAMIG